MIKHKDFEIFLDGSKLSTGSIISYAQKSRIIENDAEPSRIQNHTQTASRAFVAHKQILCDPRVRVKDPLQFFDIVITPVVMSGSGHRTVYQTDLCRMDVLLFRELLRMAVGVPGNARHFARAEHEGSNNRK